MTQGAIPSPAAAPSLIRASLAAQQTSCCSPRRPHPHFPLPRSQPTLHGRTGRSGEAPGGIRHLHGQLLSHVYLRQHARARPRRHAGLHPLGLRGGESPPPRHRDEVRCLRGGRCLRFVRCLPCCSDRAPARMCSMLRAYVRMVPTTYPKVEKFALICKQHLVSLARKGGDAARCNDVPRIAGVCRCAAGLSRKREALPCPWPALPVQVPLYTKAGFELSAPSEVAHGKDPWFEMTRMPPTATGPV